jgi:hypothetical protein
MIPRWVERLGGLGMLVLGAWLVAASWRLAHSGERFFVVGPAFGPFALGVGIGLILFPSPRSMVAARGGDGSKVRWADLTPSWKILTGGGAAAGIAYLLVLMTGVV